MMRLEIIARAAFNASCLLLSCALAHGQSAQSAKPEAPGNLIDLGGYHMHLWCMGKGEPTVVLSAGSGDFSFDWSLVLPEIAKTTRVCSYDRGGEAWSDLGPGPLTRLQEAFDLRRALQKSGIPGPYLLVGHSLGGFLAEIFASQYPKDVSGLVLVDATGWNSLMNINGKTAPIAAFSKNRTIPAPRSHIAPNDALSPEAIKGIQDFVKQYDMGPKIEPPFDKLPANAQRWRLWALGQTPHWAATQDDYFGEEAQLLLQWVAKSASPLGDLPLVVLSRKTPDNPNDLDKDHEIHQRELALLSRRGQLIFVPDSGHHIQLDQPAAVLSAVASMVTEIRTHAGPHN
jgi:pimeloyl-ACP methyl ester carboxylesterase